MSAYSRTAAMQWLHHEHHWAASSGPDFNDPSPAGRTALVDWLRRRCASMRAAGIAGAHHYHLPLHTELLRILRAERAALQALERQDDLAGSVNALRQSEIARIDLVESEVPKATLQSGGCQSA